MIEASDAGPVAAALARRTRRSASRRIGSKWSAKWVDRHRNGFSQHADRGFVAPEVEFRLADRIESFRGALDFMLAKRNTSALAHLSRGRGSKLLSARLRRANHLGCDRANRCELRAPPGCGRYSGLTRRGRAGRLRSMLRRFIDTAQNLRRCLEFGLVIEFDVDAHVAGITHGKPVETRHRIGFRLSAHTITEPQRARRLIPQGQMPRREFPA